MGDDPERQRPFLDKVWGTIRWNRSIGRPAGENLRSGFTVLHFRWVPEKIVSTGDGNQTIPGHWTDDDDVTTWDATGDDEHFEVGFSCSLSGAPLQPDKVEVGLTEQVHWQLSRPEASGYRVIDPPERTAVKGQAVAFMEFEVRQHPVIRDHR